MTNNLLVNLQVDRMNLLDAKGNGAAVGKLMALLEASPNQQVNLTAILQSVEAGVGNFRVKGIGLLEVPVDMELNATEEPKATITFSMKSGQITAAVAFEEASISEPTEAKLTLTEKTSTVLKQLGLPASEQNLKALNLLNEYHVEPSAERIKQLAEGSFLASKTKEFATSESAVEKMVIKDEQVNWSKSIKSLVLDWMSQGSKVETPKASTEKVTADMAKVQFQTTSITSEVASEIDEPSGLDKPRNVSASEVSSTVEGLKQLLQKLSPKTILPLIAADMPLDLENLQRSDQIFGGTQTIGHLKKMLMDQMAAIFQKLEPSEALKQDIVSWLESDITEFALGKQMETLEQVIAKHSPEASEQLKESFEQVNKATVMLEQTTAQMLAMHLPIKLGDHDTQIEMYVNKRRAKGSQEDFRMLLALNTNTLGQVQVLVTDLKQQVEIQFRLEDEAIKEAFEAEKADFEAQVASFNEKRIKISFGCHFKEPAVLEAMKWISADKVSGIDVRV